MNTEDRRQAIADKLAKATQSRSKPRAFVNPKPFKAKAKPAPIEPPAFVPTPWTGRPTKYDPVAHCVAAVEQMAQGHSLTGLAGFLLVSKDTIYEWMERHSEFSAAIKIGRAARVRFLENKLLKTSMGVGVTAAIFALKNADPDEYKDIITNDHSISVRIEKVSDAQLLEIIARSSAAKPLTIEHKPAELGTGSGTGAPRQP
jgi:hypothetical protein